MAEKGRHPPSSAAARWIRRRIQQRWSGAPLPSLPPLQVTALHCPCTPGPVSNEPVAACVEAQVAHLCGKDRGNQAHVNKFLHTREAPGQLRPCWTAAGRSWHCCAPAAVTRALPRWPCAMGNLRASHVPAEL